MLYIYEAIVSIIKITDNNKNYCIGVPMLSLQGLVKIDHSFIPKGSRSRSCYTCTNFGRKRPDIRVKLFNSSNFS